MLFFWLRRLSDPGFAGRFSRSLGDREFAVWRNPALRVWWIIAALGLALILIFWLFASSPAPA
jgi:hypothetical protein